MLVIIASRSGRYFRLLILRLAQIYFRLTDWQIGNFNIAIVLDFFGECLTLSQ